MKMRKRIAALLAVAMIATVMPMTAFAASTNRVTKTVTIKKDEPTGENPPKLVIDLKDDLTTNQAFYLELENAEWTKDSVDGKTFGKVKTFYEDKKTLKVEAQSLLKKDDEIQVPLYVKVTGGEASVTIDSNDTVVTKGKYVFAISEDSKAKAKVGDIKTIVDSGELAKITLEEAYAGAFNKNEEQTIKLELESDDFEFIANGKIEGKRGFSDVSDINGALAKDKKGNDIKQIVEFTIDADTFKDLQKGILEITGLKVKAAKRNVAEGDIEVYISGPFLEDETLVLAKYGDYATKLTTKKTEEWKSGRKETLKFKLEEVGNGAIVKDRSADFILSEDIKIVSMKVNDKNHTNFKKNEFYINSFKGDAAVKDGVVEFEVKVDIPAKFTGDLTVTAEGRALEESRELLLAEVKAPVTVEVEPIKVELGQKSNKGGKITITEVEKGMIERDTLVIQLPKDLKDDGAEFINVKDLDIETTGGIKVEKASLTTSSAIELKVTRKSKEAGSIEISGFEVKARRTLADGAYEVEIGGKAISGVATATDIDPITTADFILVGDQLTKAVVQFVIGSDKFLVDGKEVTMDAAAYIKDGRTMVPLRYLSYAIGIDEQAIKFNAGIVTIIDGTRIIQLQNGSKNLLVNGMTIPMSAAAEIVDGRTYVPVAEIGAVFGVTGSWDSVTQTATFK